MENNNYSLNILNKGQLFEIINWLISVGLFTMGSSTSFYIYIHLLQLNYPELVEGLVLINIDAQAEDWMDWAAHKVLQLIQYTTSHKTPTYNQYLKQDYF